MKYALEKGPNWHTDYVLFISLLSFHIIFKLQDVGAALDGVSYPGLSDNLSDLQWQFGADPTYYIRGQEQYIIKT